MMSTTAVITLFPANSWFVAPTIAGEARAFLPYAAVDFYRACDAVVARNYLGVQDVRPRGLALS